MLPDRSDSRPVLLAPAERRRLDAIAGGLEQKKFKADAELLRRLASRFDGSEGLIVVQETDLTKAAAERGRRRARRSRKATTA